MIKIKPRIKEDLTDTRISITYFDHFNRAIGISASIVLVVFILIVIKLSNLL